MKSWEREEMEGIELQLGSFASGCYIVNIASEQGLASMRFVKVID